MIAQLVVTTFSRKLRDLSQFFNPLNPGRSKFDFLFEPTQAFFIQVIRRTHEDMPFRYVSFGGVIHKTQKSHQIVGLLQGLGRPLL